MRKIRDLLRLHFDSGLSNQQIADALHLSKTCVYNVLGRFKGSGLAWPLPEGLTDGDLDRKLYRRGPETVVPKEKMPDWSCVLRELSRPHVTLKHLYEEYRESVPDGMSRTSFYRYFTAYRRVMNPTMKIIHKGGDKVFADYSGDGFEYIDRKTGEIVPTELFVSCWGASSYSFAEATLTQKAEDWCGSHVRMWTYFGCVSHGEVVDNLKSGVTKANYYDPDLNPLFALMAGHYGVAVLPARVRKPKDKAVVESNVLHLQRYLLGRLRNRVFFSLEEINQAIREELERFNHLPMQQYKQTRRQRFEELDKPYARPLPAAPFTITRVKQPTVAPDYHIEFDHHYYSVPYALTGQVITVYQVGNVLELYHDGAHLYRYQKALPNYRYTTRPEHMPPNHQAVKGWSVEGFLQKAEVIGPAARDAVKAIMERQKHPEHGFRAAMGLLALLRRFPKERIERACRRALHYNAANYRAIHSILEKRLDELLLPSMQESAQTTLPLLHENIRGSHYYGDTASQPLKTEEPSCISNKS